MPRGCWAYPLERATWVVVADPFAYAAAGHLAVAHNNAAAAEQYARRALAFDETNVAAMRPLAHAYLMQSTPELARFVLGRALALEADNALVKHDQAFVSQQ